MYPSKAFNYGEENICLLPNIVDECLEFVECIVVKYVENEMDKRYTFFKYLLGKSIDRENVTFQKFNPNLESVINNSLHNL